MNIALILRIYYRLLVNSIGLALRLVSFRESFLRGNKLTVKGLQKFMEVRASVIAIVLMRNFDRHFVKQLIVMSD